MVLTPCIGMLNYSAEEDDKKQKNHLLISLSGSGISKEDYTKLLEKMSSHPKWKEIKNKWESVVGDIELIDTNNPKLNHSASKHYGWGTIDDRTIHVIESDSKAVMYDKCYMIIKDTPPRLLARSYGKDIELSLKDKRTLKDYLEHKIDDSQLLKMIAEQKQAKFHYKCCEPKLAAEREKRLIFSKNFVDQGEIYFKGKTDSTKIRVIEVEKFIKMKDTVKENEFLIAFDSKQNTLTMAVRIENEVKSETIKNVDQNIVKKCTDSGTFKSIRLKSLMKQLGETSPILQYYKSSLQSKVACNLCMDKKDMYREHEIPEQKDLPSPTRAVPIDQALKLFGKDNKKAKQLLAEAVRKLQEEEKTAGLKEEDFQSPHLWSKAMSLDSQLSGVFHDATKQRYAKKLGYMWFKQQGNFHFKRGQLHGDKLSFENAIQFYQRAINRFKALNLTPLDQAYCHAQLAYAKFKTNNENPDAIHSWRAAVKLNPEIEKNSTYAELSKKASEVVKSQVRPRVSQNSFNI